MSPSHENHGQSGGIIHIIIVDDEPTLRLGFKYTLSDDTTTVETAANGRVALDMAMRGRFDLMILDLRMPDMDGIEVIENLRACGNPIPIILCSAGFTANAALESIRNGVVDFLLKPMRPSEIRAAVESLLNPRQEPLDRALQAIRDGHRGEAIRILESHDGPCPLEMHWLRVLTTMRESEPDADAATIENRIGASFSLLALNAPAPE